MNEAGARSITQVQTCPSFGFRHNLPILKATLIDEITGKIIEDQGIVDLPTGSNSVVIGWNLCGSMHSVSSMFVQVRPQMYWLFLISTRPALILYPPCDCRLLRMAHQQRDEISNCGFNFSELQWFTSPTGYQSLQYSSASRGSQLVGKHNCCIIIETFHNPKAIVT